MRRIYSYLIPGIILLLSSCGQEHDGFTISGTINNGAGNTIYLDILSENKIEKFDSAIINDDNTFTIQNHISTKEFFLFKLSDNNFIYLLVDSMDNVVVKGDASNLLLTYNVENSEDSKLLKEINLHNYKNRQKVDSLNRIFNEQRQTANFDSLKQKLDSVYFEIYMNEREYLIDFIKAHDNSLASFMALYQQIAPRAFVIDMNNPDDLQYYEMVDENLIKKYPDSKHAKALHSQVIELKKRYEALNSGDQHIQEGADALEIAEPTPEGDTITLSSLKGKYVLLDFWASWCAPCRKENPTLVNNYNKYASNGFEIYQVSLDKDKNAWMQAIRDDNLNWIHVSDLQFWNSYPAKLYQVRSIPANFLIDPQGKIIAKDLRGAALDNKLKEIFSE